jgi:hypothetical protein
LTPTFTTVNIALQLGIEKQHSFLQHKCHINKAMAVAFTGYAFEGNTKKWMPWIEAWVDADYINYVTSYSESNGWFWAPQAPQMPHANNLDFAIFLSMSRKHTKLLS